MSDDFLAKKQTNKLVYKNKIFDDERVVGEEKYSVNIDSVENLKIIFNCLKFTNGVNVEQNNTFFKKDGIEITVGVVSGIDGTI